MVFYRQVRKLRSLQTRRGGPAGTLRAHLQPGQPCPVCEQQVTTVPAGHDASHVAAAEKELKSAQSCYDQAADEYARLDRDHRDTTAARAETLRHVETARIDLHTALRNLHTAGDQPNAGAGGMTGKSGAAARSQTAASPTATTGGPDLATLLNPLSTPITPDTARSDLTRASDAAAQARHIFDAAGAGSNTRSPPPTPVAAAPATHAALSTGTASTSMSAAAPRPRNSRKPGTPSPASAPHWSTPLI